MGTQGRRGAEVKLLLLSRNINRNNKVIKQTQLTL